MRLKVAQQQLRAFMSDVRDFRGLQPHEVSGLAKLKQALTLIGEAELYFAQSELDFEPNHENSSVHPAYRHMELRYRR